MKLYSVCVKALLFLIFFILCNTSGMLMALRQFLAQLNYSFFSRTTIALNRSISDPWCWIWNYLIYRTAPQRQNILLC